MAGIERSPKIFDFRASGIPVQKRVDFFDTLKVFRQKFLPEGFLLVSLDVEINPRFYRGKKSERSDNRKGELDASRKTVKREEPPV